MDDAPEPGMPDTRDWTTVLDAGCEECGYRLHDPATTGRRLTDVVQRWGRVLLRPDVARRPEPRVWSPLEYAGHCRDLIEVMGQRVAVMLEVNGPTYDDFDGEAAVREHEYWRADSAELANRLQDAADRTQEVLERVGPDEMERTGLRGDGYTFTIATLCRYIVHDVEHHLYDVRG